MSRAFLITILTGAFLAMPTFVPATMTSLSGSALAQKPSTPTTDAVNLNSSRSNVNRMGGGPGKTTGSTNKAINLNTSRSNVNRMGGGPGKGTGSTNKAINLNSSRSN
jgi:hypothetical protein